MRRATAFDGKRSEKRTRRRCQLAAAVLLLLDVAVPSPPGHRGIFASVVLPIHHLIPAGVPSLAAVGLVLAVCYWLFRSPVE